MATFKSSIVGDRFDTQYPIFLQGRVSESEYRRILDGASEIFRKHTKPLRRLTIVSIVAPILMMLVTMGVIFAVAFGGKSSRRFIAIPIFSVPSFLAIALFIIAVATKSRKVCAARDNELRNYLGYENVKLSGVQFLLTQNVMIGSKGRSYFIPAIQVVIARSVPANSYGPTETQSLLGTSPYAPASQAYAPTAPYGGQEGWGGGSMFNTTYSQPTTGFTKSPYT